MRIYIPSTSRSDVRNVKALMAKAREMGHDLAFSAGSGSDSAIILGDRSEMLTEARRIIEAQMPYVHVGAGCVTLGSWDTIVRDMLTAGGDAFWAYTSFGHWTAMGGGKSPKSGFGVPILDTLSRATDPRNDTVLVAINPVTAPRNSVEHINIANEIVGACSQLGLKVAWSHANKDWPGVALNAHMQKVWPGQSLRDWGFEFGGILSTCRCIVGNSSAALMEAPMIGCPFVDCGTRQQGRPLAMGVRGVLDIAAAIENAKPHEGPSPYQHPERDACGEIIRLAEGVAE